MFHPLRMTLKNGFQMAVCAIPHSCRMVKTRGNDMSAVRREFSILNVVLMAFENGLQAAIFGVPQSCEPVPSSSDNALSIRREKGPRIDRNVVPVDGVAAIAQDRKQTPVA